MPNLTHDDIKKIANLAKLSIQEEDFPLYQQNLSNILDLVKQMDKADTSKISEMAHAFSLKQRLRTDAITSPPSRELLEMAPVIEADLFLVPKVIEKEKS